MASRNWASSACSDSRSMTSGGSAEGTSGPLAEEDPDRLLPSRARTVRLGAQRHDASAHWRLPDMPGPRVDPPDGPAIGDPEVAVAGDDVERPLSDRDGTPGLSAGC